MIFTACRAGWIGFARGAAPNLDSKDYPTITTSLFGDVAAVSLGYTPPGLSERAGFALALSDALKR